jgi:hypothetical protein
MKSSTSYVDLDVPSQRYRLRSRRGGETATSDISEWSRTARTFWSNWLSVWVDVDNGDSFAMRRALVGSLHRLLSGLGQDCTVVAPSLIPKKAGDRVNTNRRDAAMLARLHLAGELTAVWVPDAAHEAMRDLVRARATAARVLVKHAGFLLRHGQIYAGRHTWTMAYRRWLTTVRFALLPSRSCCRTTSMPWKKPRSGSP